MVKKSLLRHSHIIRWHLEQSCTNEEVDKRKRERERVSRKRKKVSNPRWPIPRKESNKWKGAEGFRTFLAEQKRWTWEKRVNHFVIDCFMIEGWERCVCVCVCEISLIKNSLSLSRSYKPPTPPSSAPKKKKVRKNRHTHNTQHTMKKEIKSFSKGFLYHLYLFSGYTKAKRGVLSQGYDGTMMRE